MNPIPRDIPLPMPASEPVLVAVLVIFLLMHIFFVNLMVGGSLFIVLYQIKGLKEPKYDRLARVIAQTITVNKSLAVVLGVGPLLAINTLYTVYFYSANALTGTMWLMVIPLVIVAFLLTYLHKYQWDAFEGRRIAHISIMGLAAGIFLFIPLIFLTNVNLMLVPMRWPEIQGFLSALLLPNVWPRYFHFLLASIALTGLFVVWLFRKSAAAMEPETGLARSDILRSGYRWAFFASLGQFVVGPTVLLTLPDDGLNGQVIATILTGAMIAMPALFLLMIEVKSHAETIGRRFWPIIVLLSITVFFMVSGRHMYREAMLAPHRAAVEAATKAFIEDSERARKEQTPARR